MFSCQKCSLDESFDPGIFLVSKLLEDLGATQGFSIQSSMRHYCPLQEIKVTTAKNAELFRQAWANLSLKG